MSYFHKNPVDTHWNYERWIWNLNETQTYQWNLKEKPYSLQLRLETMYSQEVLGLKGSNVYGDKKRASQKLSKDRRGYTCHSGVQEQMYTYTKTPEETKALQGLREGRLPTKARSEMATTGNRMHSYELCLWTSMLQNQSRITESINPLKVRNMDPNTVSTR